MTFHFFHLLIIFLLALTAHKHAASVILKDYNVIVDGNVEFSDVLGSDLALGDEDGSDCTVPLTIESVTRLRSYSYASMFSLTIDPDFLETTAHNSASVNELLHIKRSTSMRSLASDEASTIKWNGPGGAGSHCLSKAPSFAICLAIPEAPTESVSTSGCSSQNCNGVPLALKAIFESSRALETILSYLDFSDLDAFSLTNANVVLKALNNHGKIVFRSALPSFDGLSESFLVLKAFQRILQDPQMHFDNWQMQTSSFIYANPVSSLMDFVKHRLATSALVNEKYALVRLIEFLRPLGLHESFSKLPRPLSIFFNSNSSSIDPTASAFRAKVMSMVMKAAHYGHLGVLKAIRDDIMQTFPRPVASALIVDCFLLGTETRNNLAWTAFHRSVNAPNIRTANFFFNELTSDKAILDAFSLRAASNESTSKELPSYFESFFFPKVAQYKLKELLQVTLLKTATQEKLQMRAIHLAFGKGAKPQVLKQLLTWERLLIGPHSPETIQNFLELAFGSKSLDALRVIKPLVRDRSIIPVDLAIKSDWPQGLKEYSRDHQNFRDSNSINISEYFKAYLLHYTGLFHEIAEKNAINVLKFVCEEVFTIEEIRAHVDYYDCQLRQPVDVAIKHGSWAVFDFLRLHLEVQINRKHLVRILQSEPELLNQLLPANADKEHFALNRMPDNNQVTLMEWSILSGNHAAFSWFLAFLPAEYWRRPDGAGNSSIHLAVIVGNLDALKDLLDRDRSLLTLQNYFGETPVQLAHRIRNKTRTTRTIEAIGRVMLLLSEYESLTHEK